MCIAHDRPYVALSSWRRLMVTRGNSDEEYVLRLCDGVLGEVGVRQATFDWLRGDPSPRSGRQARLRVDCYWPAHALVVEHREIQHDQSVAHFDKPERVTISGVHRGLQRKIRRIARWRALHAVARVGCGACPPSTNCWSATTSISSRPSGPCGAFWSQPFR